MKNHTTEVDTPFVAFDTETTGFGANDRIVEIAIVLLDYELEIREQFVQRMNPGRPVGDSERIHGISDSALADQPLFPEILPRLADILNGRVLVAHNAAFDVKMLTQEFARVWRAKFKPNDVWCTMNFHNPNRRTKLITCARKAGISFPAEDQHSAFHDARVCAALFKHQMIEIGYDPEVTEKYAEQETGKQKLDSKSFRITPAQIRVPKNLRQMFGDFNCFQDTPYD